MILLILDKLLQSGGCTQPMNFPAEGSDLQLPPVQGLGFRF